MENYGIDTFNSYVCPGGVNPLLFSQLCLFHYAEILKDPTLGVWSIYHQVDSDNSSTTLKLAHLTKRKPDHTLLEGMDW